MFTFRLVHFGQQVVKVANQCGNSSLLTSKCGSSLLTYGRMALGVPFSSTNMTVQSTPPPGDEQQREVDDLIASMDVQLKGHDPAVMDSYEKFVTMVCRELNLPLRVEDRNRPQFVRMTLNRSPFIHKKHMRQYEFRTYCKTLRLGQLTGSTAGVFLEYIQRNLPEGMAMQVTKERLEPLTEFLHKLNGDVKQAA